MSMQPARPRRWTDARVKALCAKSVVVGVLALVVFLIANGIYWLGWPLISPLGEFVSGLMVIVLLVTFVVFSWSACEILWRNLKAKTRSTFSGCNGVCIHTCTCNRRSTR